MKYLLFLLLSVATMPFAFSQNSLDKVGLTASSPSAGAYSLRLLSTSYSGAAIGVRRSSDNATQNIGFTAGGDLDTISLLSFVGLDDGFITIWYDQSGNVRNAVQNTPSNQPKIITAGIIERANSLPAITFSGSQFLVITSTAFNNDLTGCVVYKASGSNISSGSAGAWYNMNGIFGSEQSGGTTDFAYGIYNNKFTAGNGPSDNSVRGNETINDNVTRLHSWTRDSANGKITLYSNSASDGTANLNTGTSSAVPSVAIGANQTFSSGQVFYNGNVSELILFAAVLANPRQTTEWNQGSYYGISIINTVNKNGKFSPNKSELLNRNGAIGVSGIYRTGATTSFTALSSPITTDASLITSASAISGFSIASDGGATISAGLCWSTITNPTVADTKTIDAGSAGAFSSSIINLTGNTTYYVRAYATNSVGTVYGNEISFTTLPPVIPSVVTTLASSIQGFSASSGGTISTDGGAPVTARGICWSTSTSPTTADSKTSNGSGIGTFTSSMTGLSLGTTYYVRSYATNSVGTAYGNEISFTTNASLSIGDTYQGGIIAYFFVSGDTRYVAGETHGLIVAPTNQSSSARWYNGSYTTTAATGSIIGTGSSNTTKIITSQGNTGTYAAKLCKDYRGGGYSDWFLPSKDELNKIYLNRTAIGSGLGTSTFWTSSETSSSSASRQSFSTGTQSNSSKASSSAVRAVRNF